MPQCCAVPMCSNKTGGHKFPKNKSRLEEWLRAIRRELYTPTNHSLVCKDHFSEDDYELPKDSVLEKPRPVLKKDAVPSKFLWNEPMHKERYQQCLDQNNTKRSGLKSAEKTNEKEFHSTCDMDSFDCTEVKRCYTCLEQDRTLRPLKAHAKYLFTILSPEMFYETKDTAGYLICWECEFMADKIRRFQEKLKKAYQVLKLSLKGEAAIVEGLSSQKITKIEIISITPQKPQNLPIQPENLPIQPQKLPIQPQNLPTQTQNLPIQPQKLPIQPQNLPTQTQNLPTQPQNLPFQPQNLPIRTQKPRNVPQNPPFIISPQNILKLSLKDMLEAPSKFQPQNKIKIETQEEDNYSDDFFEEGSCSNDFEELIQPAIVQNVSCDPLLVPRQNQPMSWTEKEVPPLLHKPIKDEIISPVSLPQSTFQNEQIPLRGLKEAVKVTVKAPNVTTKDGINLVSIDETPVKCQRKNDLLTKLLSKPSKGEKLFLMRQQVTDSNEPEGSKQNCVEDEAKLIILNDKELEELRAKRRSLPAFVNSQYKCHKCIDFYQSQEKIDEHNLKHDESRGSSICEICEQRFADENVLNDHYKGHFIIYECMKCSYRNRNRLRLSLHCRRKHEESSFYCKICFIEFKTFRERRMHVDKVHDQKLACKECKKTFANITRLKMHVLKIHKTEPVACPICKKKIKFYYLNKHLTTHNERDGSYYCAECGTFYKTKSTYELHLKSTLKHNTLEKLGLKCDHCDKYFGTRESLKNHIQEIGGVKYTCDICKKNSKSKKTLAVHIASVHQKIRKVKPKICEICGKSFTVRKSLVEHLNRHLGVRPHVCKDCGATFIYSAALFTHRRLVHKVKRKSEMTS